MSCRLSILSYLALLAILGLGPLNAPGADEKAKGAGTEPPEHKSDQVVTNSSPPGARKDSLKQLEEDLFKPLKELSPKTSLDGIFSPPMRPPPPASSIQSKRVKELLERRRSWIFMNPEDLMSVPTAEEMFKLPEYTADGRPKKDVSNIERYYKNLERRGKTGASKDLVEDDDFWSVNPKKKENQKDDSKKKDDEDLPKSIKDKEQALRKAFEADKADSDDSDSDKDASSPSSGRSFFTDIFGLGHPEETPEAKAAEKQRKKVLQELYGVPGLPTLPGTADLQSLMSDMGNAPVPTASTVIPKTYVPPERSDAFNPNLGMNDPTYVPGMLKDPTDKLLNDWNTAPVMPKIDPPKYLPAAPTFAAPKRSF